MTTGEDTNKTLKAAVQPEAGDPPRISASPEKAPSPHFDIGLMGFWYSCNYGSVLTYFALHQVLTGMDLSVLMIEKPYIWEKDIDYTSTHARRFAREFYRVSIKRKLSAYGELNKFCDIFMTGSDQAWHCGLFKSFGYSFFLDFANDNKKLISYATSFGGDHFVSPPGVFEKVKSYLRRFDAISVREASGVAICKQDFGVKATHVLDPIFLCPANTYEKLAEEAAVQDEGEYIAAYILDPTAQKRDSLLFAADHLNLKLIVLLDGVPYKFKRNKEGMALDNVKENVTAREFLYYIKNSKFVITDSFHGTCFSILFGKPFISIANPKRGITRFESLLGRFGLKDRLIYNASQITKKKRLFSQIEYGPVYKIIEEDKKTSMDWLKNALAAPKKPPICVNDVSGKENTALHTSGREARPIRKTTARIKRMITFFKVYGLKSAYEKALSSILRKNR